MTDELIECILNYFDQNGEEEEESDRLSEYKRKIPDYVKSISIGAMSFQLWLKSSSVFKRMEGIKVKLDEYTLK